MGMKIEDLHGDGGEHNYDENENESSARFFIAGLAVEWNVQLSNIRRERGA